ncbi:MAG TPA: ABC transporter permease [Candidatus Angelobacter sp.]|nr:ABC transporter permease [Candidatus Angelobacter sp.]
MRNFLLIARREYVERVRSRMFLFMTIFIPLLMFGVAVVPTLLITRYAGSTKHLVVAAADTATAQLIRNELENPSTSQPASSGSRKSLDREVRTSPLVVEIDANVSPAERDALNEKVRRKDVDGVIWATPDALASRKIDYITREVSDFSDNITIQQRIGAALRRQSLKSKGLSDDDIAKALQPVDLTALSPFGAGAPDAQTTFLAVFLMVMVLYMSTLLYGINVMRAVLEEKTSRIMEVMLSTATAREMMTGKILGVGAVGLTQVAIWTATAAILSNGAAAAWTGALKGVISVKVGIFFPVFFLLGYILYSTLCAAVGSMVNSEQEAQQMQFFVMTPMILAVIVLVNIIQHPGTPLSFWASMFPLTSPLIMFARIALEPTIATWQIVVSLVLLVATIYGCLVLCGRIYRIGVLMYGKKPTLPEIMKWIRCA